MDAALDQLEHFDWIIFTSENAVRAVVKRASVRGNLRNVAGRRSRAAAVGPTTAAAAERAGFFVDYRAKTHSGAALANELGERAEEPELFFCRAATARIPICPGLLRNYGAKVTEAIAYRTVTPVNLDREKSRPSSNGETDALLFFSPTAVEHFVGIVGDKILADFAESRGHHGRRTDYRQRVESGRREKLWWWPAKTTSDAVIAALGETFRQQPRKCPRQE